MRQSLIEDNAVEVGGLWEAGFEGGAVGGHLLPFRLFHQPLAGQQAFVLHGLLVALRIMGWSSGLGHGRGRLSRSITRGAAESRGGKNRANHRTAGMMGRQSQPACKGNFQQIHASSVACNSGGTSKNTLDFLLAQDN